MALRDVIRQCIHGVDLNPLAVELCKVALWLEAHVPGEPLSFLDHHIKCGNAIVGYVRREDVARRGVPDEAFRLQPGDDKDTAAALRRRNRAARKGQAALSFDPATERDLDAAVQGWRRLDAMPDHTPQEVAAKRAYFIELTQSPAIQWMKRLAALPIAQFYVSKRAGQAELVVTEAEFRPFVRGERWPDGPAVEEAQAVADQKHFFHWFLEFPEVMARGGFDCVLGNPPYLGGTYLSSAYGYPFCNYLRWAYEPTGLSDLIVFFLRRIHALVARRGFLAFIATNSIKDGDIRRDGLEQVMGVGTEINFAVRAVKWPGRANLIVSLLALQRSHVASRKSLDGKDVYWVNAFLEDSGDDVAPQLLCSNGAKIFEGSKWVGEGFLLSEAQALELIELDPGSAEVIMPLMNGEELNQHPLQKPGRCAIYFADWPLAQASRCQAALEWLAAHVKPYRSAHAEAALRAKWWLFKRPTVDLYGEIRSLSRCFVATATTKYLNFSAVPANRVFAHTIKVLASSRWDLYAVVQSTLHEIWARKYSGTLKQDLRYSPSRCFDTFAFPEGLWQTENSALASIGEKYHEHRRRLMRGLWLGLTDIYNLFHARALSPELVAKVSKKPLNVARLGYDGLLELRRLHIGLDNAVGDAYGWQDVNLGHDCVEVDTLPENDRVRFTIRSEARRELLRRLLVLNHERAEAEKQQAASRPESVKRADRRKSASDSHTAQLFGPP